MENLDGEMIESTFWIVDTLPLEVLILLTLSNISYYLLIPSVLILIFYFKMGLHYKYPLEKLNVSLSVVGSPIYSDLSSTISGVLIIRIYKKVKMFLRSFMIKVNNS